MSMDDRSQIESAGTGTHALAEVIRFLQVVRHRMRLLTLCVVAGGILGVTWYLVSPPKYESSAEILVLKTEGGAMDGGNANANNSRNIQDVMPTYQKILTSDVVLEGAIKALPTKYRIDFKGQKKAKWNKILRDSISVSSARLTNVLSVRYTSKSPESAARVVGAVVESYLTFMRQTHRSNAKDALDVLTKEKEELEQKLTEKEAEIADKVLREIRSRWPDVRVVLITGFGTIETAVEATRIGAVEFLEKPIALDFWEADELITLAKARPGRLNYATPGLGGASHLATELFSSMAAVKLNHVPYKGASPALTATLACTTTGRPARRPRDQERSWRSGSRFGRSPAFTPYHRTARPGRPPGFAPGRPRPPVARAPPPAPAGPRAARLPRSADRTRPVRSGAGRAVPARVRCAVRR